MAGSIAAQPVTTDLNELVSDEAFAEQADADPDVQAFRNFDQNQDGWLSGSEAFGLLHYDLNRDGEITLDEFLGGRASERMMLQAGTALPEDFDLFDALDSNGAGYISGVDIERGGVGSFDADGNGRITREEFFRGRVQMRKAIELQAKAAREAEIKRRVAAGEPMPAPPLDQPLQPKMGMMIGRVLTPDGEPVDRFTIEFVGYNIDDARPSIDGRGIADPNLIGRVKGRDGYYEIRLPDGSFGFAAHITIPTDGGPKSYPLRTAGDRQTIDYIEVQRNSRGVIKNMVWDPSSAEIVRPSGSSTEDVKSEAE